MRGIDARTGREIEASARLRQSITDILSTPRGSRIRRPTYGSRLFQLTDAPMTPSTVADYCAEAAQAIAMWEPEYRVSSVRLVSASPGKLVFDFVGLDANGATLTLQGITIA